MKNPKLRTVLITLCLLFVFVGNVTALGAREDSKAYAAELQQVFSHLIDQIYRSEIDVISAKDRVTALRAKYDISYTDEAGILDSIIDRAEEQTLTYDETHFYFRLLQEGKLMKYRQEAYREGSEQYKRELISLLQQQLESLGAEMNGKNELLTNLNNYYDFVGLEYDEEYLQLKELILSLNEGSIALEDMVAGLESMDKQLIRSRNLRMAQNNNEKQSQGSGQQRSGNEISESSMQASDSGSGSQKPSDSQNSLESQNSSGSQKPSDSGTGLHK